MTTLSLIGIGTGNPDHVTGQAIRAMNAADLILLQHECQGHGSKKIATELQVSTSSINSRFQRMNAKLGVGNRRMAVQLAVECGLILK